MSITSTRLLLAATCLLVGLAGCGSDAASEPTPSESTPTVSVSPPPEAPDLSDEEQSAFDEAVDRYRDYVAFLDRTGSDPKVNDDVARELATYAIEPQIGSFSDAVDQLIAADAHTEGSRRSEWMHPERLLKDQITFTNCESPGDWRLVSGDDRVPQDVNTVTRVTMSRQGDAWYVEDTDDAGEC